MSLRIAVMMATEENTSGFVMYDSVTMFVYSPFFDTKHFSEDDVKRFQVWFAQVYGVEVNGYAGDYLHQAQQDWICGRNAPVSIAPELSARSAPDVPTAMSRDARHRANDGRRYRV